MGGGNCLKIRIPNLYGFSSIFPSAARHDGQHISHLSKESIDIEECGQAKARGVRTLVEGIAANDNHIDNMFLSGAEIPEIVKSIRYERIYTNIQENLWHDIEKIESREKYCDIMISDFIRNHYQEMLFYDQYHPTNTIIIEYGRKILSILGIPVWERRPMQRYLDNGEVFIYGCVKEELGMTFEQEYIRCSACREFTLWNWPLDLEDYVRQYIIWNFGKVL